ncbi:MAG: hypothetical protein R3C18_19700 [Planctomycetaceae bacterium]
MTMSNLRTLLVLCAAALYLSPIAQADLYTNGVLSLDWLVSSSDEIHHVKMEVDDSNSLRPALIDVLKSVKSTPQWNHKIPNNVLHAPQAGQEWLLFVRHELDRSPTVFRGINLSDPLAHYRSAAVTSEGQPLKTRLEILTAIEILLRTKAPLDARCNRPAADELIGSESQDGIPEVKDPENPFAAPRALDRHLGNVRIRIDCSEWDQPGSHRLDTWLNRMLVPIKSEHYEQIIVEAQFDSSLEPGTFSNAVETLVNFPGARTEAILNGIVERYEVNNELRMREPAQKAQQVLNYLHDDMLNRSLVGHWDIYGSSEVISVRLHADQSFIATSYQRIKADDPRGAPLWQGKGRWIVRDVHLYLVRDHLIDEGQTRLATREIFSGKRVLELRDEEVLLGHGPHMVRR